MKFFDKIDKALQDQENIYCPFCNCGYVNEIEQRAFVRCPACDGKASLAIEATKVVESIDLDKCSIDEIKYYISKLGPGFHRMEFRTYLNKRL